MPQRSAILLTLTAAGLLLAACATGSAPSFADSGPPPAAPPAASPALPPGPILAASGNAVLPIFDLGGRGLISPVLPGLNVQGQLAPGGASLGVQAGPLATGVSPAAPLHPTSPVLTVDLGGGALVAPRPLAPGASPAAGLLGLTGPLTGSLAGLTKPPPLGHP